MKTVFITDEGKVVLKGDTDAVTPMTGDIIVLPNKEVYKVAQRAFVNILIESDIIQQPKIATLTGKPAESAEPQRKVDTILQILLFPAVVRDETNAISQ